MALEIASRAEPIPGYRLIDRIGSGGFGDVWKAEAPGGLIKAIKIIHGDLRTADPDGARHAEQELRALKRVQEIRHPFLLSLERYDIIDGRLMIVMELADCNLWDRFRKCRADGLAGIPRNELLGYLEESAEVLDLMNTSYGLQHLDIKPQNLFLVHNHIKVADFGLVKDLEGMRAAITGGVTPVYAAPETFDGVATRFCDQYSLAIVYQELLSGVRPIMGNNAQQLLMQHMKGVPNLTPLPPADRPVVARALSKKPEDRFPNCMEFVQALYDAGGDILNGGLPASAAVPVSHRYETPKGRHSTVNEANPLPAGTRLPPASPPPETPRTELRNQKVDGNSSFGEEVDPLCRAAPPEVVGEGCLRPALVIGIGQAGTEAVRRFRRAVVERHGSLERLPHLRLLCLDTDIDTLAAATSSQAQAPLSANEVLALRLNRASHYLKPRRNGRSLIEGWFDPQMLYRIPRNPQTLGLRCLGRLAFCDHFRTFSDKLRENLDQCLAEESLAESDRVTKLGVRTNRPRVYVVAGIGGGTGGGMLLDVAYAVRQRLRQLGYAKPDVVGILLSPNPERGTNKSAALGNAYAALKELNHYSLPETVFTASHDNDCHIHDSGAPFRQTFIVPLDADAKSENRAAEAASRRVADYLRRDLLSPFGRTVDDCREELPPPSRTGGVVTTALNTSAYTWPKQQILSQGSRWLGEALVSRWLKADLNVIREPLLNWLKERWASEKLGSDSILERLHETANKKVGQPPEQLFAAEAQPFVPRGWFARDPDRAKLWQSLSKVVQIVGMPDERAMQRQVGTLEATLIEAGDAILRELSPKIVRLPRSLLEHPDYRLEGAGEAIKQLDAMLTKLVEQYEPVLNDLTEKAAEGYYKVFNYLNDEMNLRRSSPAEIAESLASFPKLRYQNLVQRQVYRIYIALRGQLHDLAREFHYCRQRLEDLMARFKSLPAETSAATDQTLFPAGCTSVEQVVKGLRESIKPEELRALDKSLQRNIEHSYQALFSVCMSSINMLGNLHSIVEEQARAFLNERLGESSVDQMFLSRFSTPETAVGAIRRIHEQAGLPVKTDRAPGAEICALALPAGEQRAMLEQFARQALAGKVIDFLTSPEEVMVYREWPRFPITALPAAGPQARDAYTQMEGAGPGSGHTRNDVGEWFPLSD